MPSNKSEISNQVGVEVWDDIGTVSQFFKKAGAAVLTVIDAIPKGMANTPFGYFVGSRHIIPPENPLQHPGDEVIWNKLALTLDECQIDYYTRVHEWFN